MRELPSLKKLSAGGDYYRIRVGDYRIGVTLKDETVEPGLLPLSCTRPR